MSGRCMRPMGNLPCVMRVQSSDIVASDPDQSGPMFEPAETKIYRHPTFYDIPDAVGHM